MYPSVNVSITTSLSPRAPDDLTTPVPGPSPAGSGGIRRWHRGHAGGYRGRARRGSVRGRGQQMRAAVLEAAQRLVVQAVAEPRPTNGEALIALELAGV